MTIIREFRGAISALEKANKSTVFVLAPSEYTSAPIHSCTLEESERQLLDLRPVNRMDLIIESTGGYPDYAFMIANLIRSRSKRLVVYVPRCAKSAATLICLVADEIRMRETAELGPLDTQIGNPRDSTERVSALNGFKGLEALSQYTHKFVDDTVQLLIDRSGMKIREAYALAVDLVTPIVSSMHQRVDAIELGELKQSLEIAREYGVRLLKRTGSYARAKELLETLVYHYPSHSFAIDYREAKEIGLPAGLVSDSEELILRKMFRFLDNVPYVGIPRSDKRLSEDGEKRNAKPQRKAQQRQKPRKATGEGVQKPHALPPRGTDSEAG